VQHLQSLVSENREQSTPCKEPDCVISCSNSDNRQTMLHRFIDNKTCDNLSAVAGNDIDNHHASDSCEKDTPRTSISNHNLLPNDTRDSSDVHLNDIEHYDTDNQLLSVDNASTSNLKPPSNEY